MAAASNCTCVAAHPPPPPSSPACAAFATPLADTELAGADIGPFTPPPLSGGGGFAIEACCARCVADDGCAAFVSFNDACYLKSTGYTVQGGLPGRTAYVQLLPPPLPPPALPPAPPVAAPAMVSEAGGRFKVSDAGEKAWRL